MDAPNSKARAETTSNEYVSMVALQDVAVGFPTDSGTYEAVKAINLEVDNGEFLCIIGPSGCGKSTLLGVISGLLSPSRGQAEVMGERVTGIPKDIAYVFQQDALLPWKTVQSNIELALRLKRREVDKMLVESWINRVGLSGFESAYPYQLSGGMRKRAALAQALVAEPRLVLMDEPFSALDVQTRNLMEEELLQIWERSDVTIVFVTHDLEEAIALSDRVCLMTAGPSSTFKSIFDVDLPRPRHLNELKYDAGFTQLYERIWNALRDEVMQAFKRQRDERS